MLNISEEDYGALERKIQAEIRKIFAKFIRDIEKQAARPGTTRAPEHPQEPKRRIPAAFARTRNAASAMTRNPRARKKLDTNRLLHGIPVAPGNQPETTIEHDMEKIFGKKNRRRSFRSSGQ